MGPHGIHVLGIESSFDDTGVAIVRQDGKVLSNCIHSQLKDHVRHGGLIPMVAKEYHMNNIDRVANQAFQESGLRSVAQDIDAIAVTNRPGLPSSLEVGLNYARTLAKKYSKPLIPIHHMRAHALMPLLENRCIKFPFLAFLLSGGHCILSICERYNKFYYLGGTIDSAPGEVLDKVARRLRLKNLGHPYDKISGGAAIEKMAERPGVDRFKYFNDEAVVLHKYKSCDFSFSGYLGKLERLSPSIDELWDCGDRDRLVEELGHICGSIQRVVLVQLFKRLQRAMCFYRHKWRYEHPDAFNNSDSPMNHLGYAIREGKGDDQEWLDVVVSGGVSANGYLTRNIASALKTELDPSIRSFSPTRSLCSDNGLMIAWNGMLRYLDHLENKSVEEDIEAPLNKSVIYDPSSMDLLRTSWDSIIGSDISPDVRNANFSLARFVSPELKTANVVKSAAVQGE